MGYFKIIEPEETVNYILDPSAEASDPDTSWTISGDGATPDVARVTTDCWIGTGAFSFDIDDGTNTVLAQSVTVTESSYTLSAYVKRAASGVVSNTQCQAHFDSAAANWDSITAVNDNWYYCVKTATATAGSRDFGIVGKEAGLLVDAIQLENKAYPTTYCDGSLVGNRTDGYEWSGTANASTSTRHAQERTGGRVRDIEDDLGVLQVNAFAGWGMIEPDHQLINYALAPGGAYQNTKYPARLMDLALTFSGTSLGDMHTDRQALIDAIKLDRTFPKQPFVFRYVVDDTTLEINALYAGGLPGSNPARFIERGAMRLLCPDPYWQSPNEHVKQLSVSVGATASYLIRNSSGAEWEVFDAIAGTSAEVKAIVETSTDIYIGGAFDTVGGVTVNNVARYDKAGESWYPLDSASPGVDGIVNTLTVDSTGLVYIGGEFDTTTAGATVNNICSYTPGGDSFAALGATPGTNSAVYSIAADSADDIYVAGAFVTAGGTTISRVAKWDGASWSGFSSGIGPASPGAIYCYALVLDGSTIYVGGDFDTTGASLTVNNISKWNGTAWVALGDGLNDTVRGLAVDDDGALYAVGSFTASGSDTITKVGRWDGLAWENKDASVSTANLNTVYWQSNTQRLYIGGNNGIVKYLEGLDWFNLDVDYADGTSIDTGAIGGRGDSVLFGFDNEVAVNLPVSTTVVYNGKSETFPTIAIAGPGTVTRITNLSTGSELVFNSLTLASGETMQVELQPGKRRIYSNVRTNLFQYVDKTSDWVEFSLLPGNNVISMQVAITVTPYFRWRNRYESADGAG